MIVVLEPGLFTTVQDLGRPGHARIGVSAAGAADPVALRVANRLAGNPEGAPALEMTLIGGAYRFTTAAFVALAGADMQATLDGVPFPPWSARPVEAGATLACGAAASGARAVLAARGGIAVPPLLGSASTHVPSGLGGFEGRPLRRGDALDLGTAPGVPPGPRRVRDDLLARLAPWRAVSGGQELGRGAPGRGGPGRGGPGVLLRSTAGPHADRFDAGAMRLLLETVFTVSASSDRMGLRLEGVAIPQPPSGTMLTEGMPLGAVQVPPDGLPVILFVDHQTTGGYPVPISVVSADLAAVGQLRPQDRVRFGRITIDEARALLFRQEEILGAPDLITPDPPGRDRLARDPLDP